MKTDWNSATIEALASMWESFLLYLPNLVVGLILLIFGWFIATGFGKIITQILKRAKFDDLLETEDWKAAMRKAKIDFHASKFVGLIVKWVIYIFFIWSAVGVFGLGYFTEFMGDVIRYIPNVIVASLIFVVTVMLADFLSKIIIVATERAKFKYTDLAGEIARWSIWIFAGFAILIELGIAKEMLSTLFTGIVALLVIAGGIAFGLGGKEIAADFLRKIGAKLKE